MNAKSKVAFAVGVCLTIGAMIVFARHATNRYRQIQTVALLNAIGNEIDASERSGKMLSQGLVAHVVATVGGKDAWGTPLLFLVRPRGLVTEYLVVSVGADHRLDTNLDSYLTSSSDDIHGEASKDIVLRDGVVVTLAGK